MFIETTEISVNFLNKNINIKTKIKIELLRHSIPLQNWETFHTQQVTIYCACLTIFYRKETYAQRTRDVTIKFFR